MTKKLPDDTIYMKVNGRLKPVGRLFDRDSLGYGNFFVYVEKYSRGVRSIKASPNPDFIGLETAVEESRDELRDCFMSIISNYLHMSGHYPLHDVVDKVIESIRKTYNKKKKELIKSL